MLNKVVLMGRLTKDPELQYSSANNVPFINFTLAVNKRFAKKGEEKQADFPRCIAWNKTAEFINNYFAKGKMIVVVGRLETSSYEDADGKKIYKTHVVAEEVSFGDSKTDDSNKSNSNTSNANSNDDGGFFPVEYDENEDSLPF